MVPNLLDSDEKPPRAAPKPFGYFLPFFIQFFEKHASDTHKATYQYKHVYIYAICSLHTYIYIYIYYTSNNACEWQETPPWFFFWGFPRILRILLAKNLQVFSLVGRDYKPQLSKLNGLDGFYWAAPISVAWLFWRNQTLSPWMVLL